MSSKGGTCSIALMESYGHTTSLQQGLKNVTSRRSFLAQSALVGVAATSIIEGCGGGGGGANTGSSDGSTRSVLEGLSIATDKLSAFVTTESDPGALLDFPGGRGRQVDTNPYQIGAYVGYSISVSHQMLFDTYKRVVHSFYLTRDSLSRAEVPVNGKTTVLDNTAWVAGTMRKQLLTAISLVSYMKNLLSAGIADEAKGILSVKDDLHKGVRYCSFMMMFNKHVIYAFEAAGKTLDRTVLLPDDPALDSDGIDDLMYTINDRIDRIPYGIAWSEGRDVSKLGGSSRGIEPSWVLEKTLDYMSQSWGAYTEPFHEWNGGVVRWKDQLARQKPPTMDTLYGDGSWIDKTAKGKALAKGIRQDLLKDFTVDLAKQSVKNHSIPMSVRDIEQIDAAADVIGYAKDAFKFAAIASAGGGIAIGLGLAGGIYSLYQMRESLKGLTDSLMDEYFANDPTVKAKLDKINAAFRAKKQKELDETVERIKKVLDASRKNGQPVPVKQLPVVTNPNRAETDILADSYLLHNNSNECGSWPRRGRITRAIPVVPPCFDEAIDQMKLAFESTVKSCPNLGYVKTSTGFTYFHADFAAIVRRDPSMKVAEFPAITSAQMMCTAPGYLPMVSDSPKNINEILQLPELQPLSSVSLGVNINVK